MNNVFWLIKNQLAGRVGPDTVPWDLSELRTGGIGAVLSVNAGILCEPKAFAAADIDYACIRMPANEPPIPADDAICLAALPQTYRFIRERLDNDRAVLVHCTAGKDRTGMTMAYFLMREQALTPAEALAKVRVVRPVALSALGWEAMGLRVLEQLHRDR